MSCHLLIVSLVVSLNLLALPSLTNKCGEKGIKLKLPTDSDIVVYNKECDTAFIGPPSTGTAEVVAIVGSSNLAFCETVKTLPKTINALNLSIDVWSSKLIELSQEALNFEKDLNAQRGELIRLEEKAKLLDDQIESKQEQYDLLLESLRAANDQLDICQKLKTQDQCEFLKEVADKAASAFISFDSEVLKPLKDGAFLTKKEIRTSRRIIQQVAADLEENGDIFAKYKKRLRELYNEAMEQYGAFGKLEGATVQVLFESNWKTQIETAKQVNPYSNLHITALPVTNTSLHVDDKLGSVTQLNIPSSLLYASVPGFSDSGTTASITPSGENTIEDLDVSVSPVNSYISGVTGRLVLSLIGSCGLTDENNKLLRHNINELAAYISINTIYEYPLLHERSHKVFFKASKFAEKIENLVEKGGFFRTESIHDILNDNFSREDFRIDFEVDSSEDIYTEQEKELLEREAKKEILDRVLKEIGTIAELADSLPVQPSNLKQSGAAKIYAQAPCFGWSYCYATKFVIGVIDSVFGNRKALANFKARNSALVSYTHSSRKPATYSFTTTFKPKK